MSDSLTGPDASDASDASPVVSRRHTLRLAAALLALGQSLGLPPELFAEETLARIELKYYRSPPEGDAQLIYAEPLASPVVAALMSGSVAELEIKWYDGRSGLLGSVRLPAEVRNRLERMRG